MALDKITLQTTLETKLKENFQKGVEEEWSSDKAAEELATLLAEAIHAYVSAAEVQGVTTTVKDVPGTTVIGAGTQNNVVQLT